MTNPVEKAIGILGGVTATAHKVGVRVPSVIKWRKNGRVPPGRALVVHRLTQIPLAELLAEGAAGQSVPPAVAQPQQAGAA